MKNFLRLPRGSAWLANLFLLAAHRAAGILREVVAAVGAEFVEFADFVFALRAGRMEIAFAVGAEVEACSNGGGALRARIGKWFAQEQIDDEAD